MLVAGVVLSLAGVGVSANTLPALLIGLSARYAVAPGTFGIAFLFQYVAFALFAFLSGLLSGRRSFRLEPIVVTALAATGLIFPFVGMIPGFPMLILFIVAVGALGGLVESNATTILTQHEGNSPGQYVYLSQLFYCLGAMLAPLLVGILQSVQVPDLFIGVAVGAMTLVVALIVYLWIYRTPRREGLGPIVATPESRRNDGKSGEAPTIGTLSWFIVVMILYVMIEISAGSWIPAYLQQTFQMTPSFASFHLTLFWSGLAATRLLYVFIRRGALRLQLALQVGGILTSVSILFLGQSVPHFRILSILLLGASCGPVWPLIVNLYSKRYARKHYVMYIVGSGSVGALIGIAVTSTFFKYMGVRLLPALLGSCAVLLVCGLGVLVAKIGTIPRGS